MLPFVWVENRMLCLLEAAIEYQGTEKTDDHSFQSGDFTCSITWIRNELVSFVTSCKRKHAWPSMPEWRLDQQADAREVEAMVCVTEWNTIQQFGWSLDESLELGAQFLASPERNRAVSSSEWHYNFKVSIAMPFNDSDVRQKLTPKHQAHCSEQYHD
jgi:hypothetical protein